MTYARYGESAYKFGNSSRFYGAGPSSTNLIYRLLIDWDGDGVFDGTNDAIYMTGYEIERGRDFFIKVDGEGKASGFEPMKVGRLKIDLDNTSGRYDPYNSSSPLYPHVLPGRLISFAVDYNGTTYPLFAGKITDIQAEGGFDAVAIITAEDGLRRLQDYDASVAVQTDIDIDDAIGMVLDDVEYPSLWGRNLEDSGDVLDYWWADNRAKTDILSLADAAMGNFFIAADGAATFYSRHHTNVSILTLTSSDFGKKIPIPQPWEVVRNIIKVTAHPPLLVSGQTLWTLVDKPVIKAGDTFTVWAPYSYNSKDCSAINVIEPAATTDYTVNTASDGSGTDITSSCVITSFIDFGKKAMIVLQSNSIYDGYITLEKVRGDAITFPYESIQIAEDSASKRTYDPRTFALDSEWLQSTALAADIAGYLVSFLKTPQRFLEVQIVTNPSIQFMPDLMDMLDVTITKLSVDGHYRIGSINHKSTSENCQGVTTTWRLEPFPDLSGYWQFTALIGVTTYFGI